MKNDSKLPKHSKNSGTYRQTLIVGTTLMNTEENIEKYILLFRERGIEYSYNKKRKMLKSENWIVFGESIKTMYSTDGLAIDEFELTTNVLQKCNLTEIVEVIEICKGATASRRKERLSKWGLN